MGENAADSAVPAPLSLEGAWGGNELALLWRAGLGRQRAAGPGGACRHDQAPRWRVGGFLNAELAQFSAVASARPKHRTISWVPFGFQSICMNSIRFSLHGNFVK